MDGDGRELVETFRVSDRELAAGQPGFLRALIRDVATRMLAHGYTDIHLMSHRLIDRLEHEYRFYAVPPLCGTDVTLLVAPRSPESAPEKPVRAIALGGL